MGIIKNRWLTAVSLIMVLFLVTACFQQVGDEAQGQAVSLVITDTNTPPPPPTDTATAADLPISNPDTATPTATNTQTETPTEVLAVAQAGDEQPALQPTETDDPFELTATQLVIDSTMRAVLPTTQAAATLFFATDTPTVETQAPIDTGTGQQPLGVDCVHEVRAGETLFRLSQYYGISVNDIVSRNGIVNMNIISIGQRLIINGCGTTGALPPPTSVPSPTVTPFQLNTTTGTGGPGLGDPNAGTGTTTSLGCVAQYTVQQYDTLFQISLNYGVSAQSIANANGIVNLGRINMGDVLCIPGA